MCVCVCLKRLGSKKWERECVVFCMQCCVCPSASWYLTSLWIITVLCVSVCLWLMGRVAFCKKNLCLEHDWVWCAHLATQRSVTHFCVLYLQEVKSMEKLTKKKQRKRNGMAGNFSKRNMLRKLLRTQWCVERKEKQSRRQSRERRRQRDRERQRDR